MGYLRENARCMSVTNENTVTRTPVTKVRLTELKVQNFI